MKVGEIFDLINDWMRLDEIGMNKGVGSFKEHK